jgi:hypothetical protein
MKYLLLSILLITPQQLISTNVIVDLENKGRQGSEYIKDIQWVTDRGIGQSANIPGQNTISEINNEVRFSVPIEPKNLAGGITKDTPTMKLINVDGRGQDDIKFNLSQSSSDKCLMLNYPVVKSDSGISVLTQMAIRWQPNPFLTKATRERYRLGNLLLALLKRASLMLA